MDLSRSTMQTEFSMVFLHRLKPTRIVTHEGVLLRKYVSDALGFLVRVMSKKIMATAAACRPTSITS